MPHNVLVTGGAGYVGSHICKALAAAGHRPIALDDMAQGHLWALQWGPHVQADLRNTAATLQILRQHQVNAVVHAGHFSPRGEVAQHPDLHYEKSVGGVVALLQAMHEAHVGGHRFGQQRRGLRQCGALAGERKRPAEPANTS